MRSVLAECCEPSRTRSDPSDRSAIRRRMKARRRISLSSESRCTSSRRSCAIDGDDAPASLHPPAHQAAPRREHVDLAGELPGPCTTTGCSRSPTGDDLDRPLEHHEEPRVLLADVEQQLARRDFATLADRGDPRDLRVGQLGEHLRGARHHRVGVWDWPSRRRIAEPIGPRPSADRRWGVPGSLWVPNFYRAFVRQRCARRLVAQT